MATFWQCSQSVNEEYGPSFFKRLWKEHGKTIHFLRCENDIYRLDARTTSDLTWNPPADVSFWSLECGLEEPDFPFNDELTFNALVQGLTHFIEKHWNGSPICLYEGPLRSEEILGEYLQYLASKLPEEIEVYALIESSSSPAERAYLLSPERFGHIKTSRLPVSGEIGIVLPLDEYCSPKVLKAIDELTDEARIIPEKYLTEMWDGLSHLIAFEDLISAQGIRKLQGFEAALGTVDRKVLTR